MDTLTVDVNVSRPYRVHVGTRLLEQVGGIVRPLVAGARAAIVTDSNVGPLCGPIVEESLVQAGFKTTTFVFAAGESNKTLATYEEILAHLADNHLDRGDVVIALGGGVTGDMAGFAAATYLRGIAYVQVPTSLLAMVDSSVGGKCAVDLPQGKNLVGAFWQPKTVIADVGCLGTLSAEQLADGCGEVIKHAVIADANLLDILEAHPITLTSLTENLPLIAAIVARNVEIKRNVVVQDERESGVRKLLNFGHSIGHAIEARSHFALGHGTSVAMGMVAITRATASVADDPEPLIELAHRIAKVCEAHGLKTSCPYEAEELVASALHDKKRRGDAIDLVLPLGVASCTIQTVELDQFFELMRIGLSEEELS